MADLPPPFRAAMEKAGWLKPGTDHWTEDGSCALECLWHVMEELKGVGMNPDEETWLALRKLAVERFSD